MATYTLWSIPSETRLWGGRSSVRFPSEMTCGNAAPSTGFEPRGGRSGVPGAVYLQPIHHFDAATDLDADRYFVYCTQHGCPHTDQAGIVMPDPAKLWRYRGAAHYQIQQGERLKIPSNFVAECRHNRESKDLQVELSGLCERYHKSRGHVGNPSFNQPDLAVARATLAHAERHAAKLVCTAAAAVASLDEAYRAFGLDVPDRGFAVLSDYDVTTTVNAIAETIAQTEPNPDTPAPANGQPAHHPKRKHAGAS